MGYIGAMIQSVNGGLRRCSMEVKGGRRWSMEVEGGLRYSIEVEGGRRWYSLCDGNLEERISDHVINLHS